MYWILRFSDFGCCIICVLVLDLWVSGLFSGFGLLGLLVSWVFGLVGFMVGGGCAVVVSRF